MRITAAELAKIEEGAKILAINKSRYIARMAAEGKIIDTYSPRQRTLVISLIGIANNLNQMAKVAHTAGIMPIVAEIDELFFM